MSTTDPEARVMKMSNGEFRPAFNAQLAVDRQRRLIAGVDLVEQGSDMRQWKPMHGQMHARYSVRPDYWLSDGGFTKLEAVDTVTALGTQPLLLPPRSRNPAIDPLTPKVADSPALANWRQVMASEWGKGLYVWRGASVECVNA